MGGAALIEEEGQNSEYGNGNKKGYVDVSEIGLHRPHAVPSLLSFITLLPPHSGESCLQPTSQRFESSLLNIIN
jgi:hypothetical protein